MKTRISLLTVTSIVMSLAVGGSALAQMAGYEGPTNPARPIPIQGSVPNSGNNPAANPGVSTKKPGERLPDGTIVATVVTKAEALKKYPAPKSGYPVGDPNYSYSHKAGYLQSPYSRRVFDCSGLPRGSYILDTYANHVFLKP